MLACEIGSFSLRIWVSNDLIVDNSEITSFVLYDDRTYGKFITSYPPLNIT